MCIGVNVGYFDTLNFSYVYLLYVTCPCKLLTRESRSASLHNDIKSTLAGSVLKRDQFSNPISSPSISYKKLNFLIKLYESRGHTN